MSQQHANKSKSKDNIIFLLNWHKYYIVRENLLQTNVLYSVASTQHADTIREFHNLLVYGCHRENLLYSSHFIFYPPCKMFAVLYVYIHCRPTS